MKSRTNFWHRAAGLLAAGAISATGWGFTFILNDDTGLPIKWPAGATSVGAIPVTIMLGTGQTLSDGTNFNTSVQAAIDDWNGRIGAVQFQATQQAAGSAGDHNGKNELAFSATVYGKDFGDTTLAVTTGYSRGNDRTESDTLFKSSLTWDSYRGGTRNNVFDIRRVALHELGHTLGLDHPDQATPPQSVTAMMNSHITSLDDLADDDIQGAQSLYGPPGVPPNNNFSSATNVTLATGKLTLKGYNTNATKETGEPTPVSGSSGGRSVWWRWQPPSDGNVTIDTKGSYYDTTLAIFTGSTLTGLTTVATSDDIQDGVVQASTVTFNVAATTTYQIAVDGFNGDASGADTGGITLNFNFVATAGTPPAITTQPTNATTTVGGSASFSVVASGSAPLSYQWIFNGSPISGATSSSYSISGATTSQAGNYSVTVSNNAGSVASAGVSLTVNAAPVTPPPSSGGGGGGGGAPSLWFIAVLSALGLGRRLQRGRL